MLVETRKKWLPSVKVRFEPRQYKGLTNEELGGDNSKEALVCRTGGKQATTKLQEHRRMGHLSIPSKRVWCPGCAVAEGERGAQTPPVQRSTTPKDPCRSSTQTFTALSQSLSEATVCCWWSSVMPLRMRG